MYITEENKGSGERKQVIKITWLKVRICNVGLPCNRVTAVYISTCGLSSMHIYISEFLKCVLVVMCCDHIYSVARLLTK